MSKISENSSVLFDSALLSVLKLSFDAAFINVNPFVLVLFSFFAFSQWILSFALPFVCLCPFHSFTVSDIYKD